MSFVSNKRIAKNTLLLYGRTFIVMIVSLYTSRLILNILGETDFGIYNVVGGIVILFSFVYNALSSATQRFLNFELGKGRESEVKRVFSMSVTVHITLSVIIFLLAETIGLWLVNNYLNIPSERMYAARWVYQFSILSCCFNILRIPYNSAIIAYEKMSFYAYLSILEVLLKLGVAFLLSFYVMDKLILYSFLMFVVVFVSSICYWIYCKIMFRTTKYFFFWDKLLYRKLLGFSGWSILGSAAGVGASQGLNIILNMFCGVVANAAFGVTNQVSSAINTFVYNFQLAFKPQLIKSYAAGEKDDFLSLVNRSAKFSFFLLYTIALPLIINTDFVLGVWLVNVPNYSVPFIQWTLCYLLIDAISAPLWMSVQATGNIRNYQVLVSIIILLNIPISVILLKVGFSPVSVFIAKFIIEVVVHFARMFYLNKVKVISFILFWKKVMIPILVIVLITIPAPIVLSLLLAGWQKLIVTTLASVVVIGITVYFLGITISERQFILSFITKEK